MIEVKIEVKTKRHDDKVKKMLAETVEKVMMENGCSECHGKNLTVYINEIGRKSVDGLFYCHDCEKKGMIHVEHDIFDALDKIDKKFDGIFKGL